MSSGEEGRLAELVRTARAVREHAHAPYSGFKVGAAVLTASGRIYAGCNVENASYGATLCAERSAIASMIADGEREIRAVAVFTEADPPAMPCGICRQSILEFGDDPVIVVASPEMERNSHLSALLPEPFRFTRE